MDLTKDRKKLLELYKPSTADFTFVDVPRLPFAMIDGEGSPNDTAGKTIKDLYTVIYPIRREARVRMGKDFVEPPVEMLYWEHDIRDFSAGNKDKWKWRAMITLPIWTDATMFSKAVAQAKDQMDAIPASVRMEYFEEGRCAQIMHVGRTNDIPATLERLFTRFLPEHHLEPSGAYHEIYLDDWNRIPPDRRKVILRQPVRPLSAA